MNKNDVLKIIEAIASDPYFKEYKIKKSDASIILKSDTGYRRSTIRIPACELYPNYRQRKNYYHRLLG